MDIVPIYKRVIGLDVHLAQITGWAIIEQPKLASDQPKGKSWTTKYVI